METKKLCKVLELNNVYCTTCIQTSLSLCLLVCYQAKVLSGILGLVYVSCELSFCFKVMMGRVNLAAMPLASLLAEITVKK